MENNIEITATKEFLERRKQGIGGSDVAAIMGISPFKSSYQVWHEKVHGTNFIPRIDSFDSSDIILELGHVLEPYIAMKYGNVTRRLLIKCTDLYKHPEYEFMIANPDRIIIDDDKGKGILEIKTKGAYTNWGDYDIPPYYMTQVQHYLSVLGISWASFVYLDLGKREIQYFDIERNDECIERIMNAEIEFWELVKNKTPPSIDGSESTNTFIRNMYKNETKGEIIDLTGNTDVLEFIAIIDYVRTEKKKIDNLETGAKNNLMVLMGNAQKAIGENFSITWKTPKDRIVFDVDRFKNDYPDLYANYANSKPQSRRFTVRIGNV